MSHSMIKSTKWPVSPAKTDQPGRPPGLIKDFAVSSVDSYVTSALHAGSYKALIRLGPDLRLHWAHRSFCWFVVAQFFFSGNDGQNVLIIHGYSSILQMRCQNCPFSWTCLKQNTMLSLNIWVLFHCDSIVRSRFLVVACCFFMWITIQTVRLFTVVRRHTIALLEWSYAHWVFVWQCFTKSLHIAILILYLSSLWLGCYTSCLGLWSLLYLCTIVIWVTWQQNLLLPSVKNKGVDQPAHPRSLISTFVVRCLDNVISLVSISKISRLASFCSWAGRFVSTQVANPKDRFSCELLMSVLS